MRQQGLSGVIAAFMLMVSATCPAFASDALSKSSILPTKRYERCTEESRTRPDHSLEKALRWYDEDQSLGAQHCIALSLYGMRHFREAAETLDKTANSVAYVYPELKANILLQASKAWSMHENFDKALASVSKAIAVAAENQHEKLMVHLLLERSAVIQRQAKDVSLAVQDLDHILSLQEDHSEALLQRARLMEKLGYYESARSDYEELVKLNPNHVEAMRFLTSARPGAGRVVPTAASGYPNGARARLAN